MSAWDRVLKNEEQQRGRFADAGLLTESPSIHRYYPELHEHHWAGQFCNTIFGLPLIPQLLTTPHVLVDLYDWQSPDQLIETYGADLPFVLRLRDEGFVQLCANLPVERYRASEWLHPLLAQSATIFRSSRTQLYLDSIEPSAQEQLNETKDRLARWLTMLSDSEVQNIAALTNSAYPPKGTPALSNALATWMIRVKVLVPTEGAELQETIFSAPETGIPRLRQLHFCIVSPLTAGLGGDFGFIADRLRPYVMDSDEIKRLSRSDQARLQAVHDFLCAHTFGHSAEKFSTKQYWELHSDAYAQRQLIKRLRSDTERKRAFEVERTLRRKISASRGDWPLDAVEEYVDQLKANWHRVRRALQSVVMPAAALPLFFSADDGTTVAAVAGIGVAAASCAVVREPARRALEAAFPNLRVVNLAQDR